MVPIAYNVRSLFFRKATTLAALFGVALVVFVLSVALMLSNGLRKTLGTSGQADRAIVLRKGSDAEMPSSIDAPALSLILAAPGVKMNADATAMGVGEVVVVITMDKAGQEGISNVQIRGTTEQGIKFRPEIKLIEGRLFQPGSDEVIIGKRLRGRFVGLDVGQSFDLRKNRPVKVVGVFESDGSSYESEVLGDLDTVRSSFGRQGLFSSVRVQLESASKFDAFQATISQDKRLGLEAMREDEYYKKQSEGTSIFINALGISISAIFSIAAIIGAMITMYASIASRGREIGTLRALGFSRLSILVSFLFETLLLALGGGLFGIAAASLLGFVKFSMMNFASFSEIVFTFTPTAKTLITALIFAGGVGMIAGFLPAVRAARTPPLKAMRE